MLEQEFFHKVVSCKQFLQQLEGIDNERSIQETASILKGLYFTPMLVFPTGNFLYFSRQDAINEIDRVSHLSKQDVLQAGFEANQDFQELKREHIALLAHEFQFLHRLRQDDPFAWDVLDELYEDD